MESLINTIRWLLELVVNDPVKLAMVLMFLALIFSIWVLWKIISEQKTKE